MEIILGKRIEEVERERISRRDGLRRAVYRGWGCETCINPGTRRHLFPFLFSPVFSLFFFRQMDVELKLKKGGTFGLARLGFPRGNNDPRGTREKRESKRGWRQWTNERDTAERRAQSVYDNSSPIDKLIFLPRISREREKQRESIDRAEIMARTSFEPRFIIY